jgi:hypothetical protein
MSARRWMLASSAVYVVGLGLHTADHIGRGVHAVTGEVLILGVLSTIAGLVTVGLIIADHPKAPIVAVVVGFQVAIGVAVVHIPPHWGVLSDPFIGASGTGVSAFSWAVVLLEIVGALALGTSGLAALGTERRLPSGKVAEAS